MYALRDSVTPRDETNGDRDDPLWYKDAIIYELPVKSFCDGNADGIGDFTGLCEKLDYLQSLGVTCLWLLPFFPSPLKDDGYDIADYVSVHPSYGTLDDFKKFLHAAHDRGLQVVIELVLNHTSDQHPWFQRARSAPPRIAGARLLRVERYRPALPAGADHLRRRRALELDVGSGRAGVLLAPVFSSSAGSQLRQPGGRPRDAGGPGLLARSGRRRLPHRRGAVPGRARWHEPARTSPRHTPSSRRSGRTSMRGLPAGCCSPRPTSCRPTCGPTSVTATNVTWPITSRSCRVSSWRCTWRIDSRSST